jgi:hypothetical protein
VVEYYYGAFASGTLNADRYLRGIIRKTFYRCYRSVENVRSRDRPLMTIPSSYNATNTCSCKKNTIWEKVSAVSLTLHGGYSTVC